MKPMPSSYILFTSIFSLDHKYAFCVKIKDSNCTEGTKQILDFLVFDFDALVKIYNRRTW